MQVNRRTFISQLVLTTLYAATTSNPIFSSEHFITSLPSEFIDECRHVYKSWCEKEEVSPDAFLKEQIEQQKGDETSFSALTDDDFKKQSFISVHGLVLSKSEAAIFAVLGMG